MSTEVSDLSQTAYRYQFLQNAVREHEICTCFRVLRSVNIEPILLKGWSVARFYPDPALRPLGDIDMLVPDEQLPIAETKLREYGELNVDWHGRSEMRAEYGKPEEIFRRSQLVSLLHTDIRVLCPEDNLHFVAIHMLRHGGWSPLWVRDLLVLLEHRGADFDWDTCLGIDSTRAGWVLSALVLAHRLAGADVRGTPAEEFHIPVWLERAVRRAQTTPAPGDNQPPESMWVALTHPWRMPKGLRKRWPNPVSAAIMTGAPFDKRPALLHQLRYCAKLAAAFFSRVFSY